MVSPDTGSLGGWTRALHMALRLGWVAAESTGWLWCYAPLVEHSIAPAIDWSTCFFAAETRISPRTFPSVSRPWFGRIIRAAVCGSVGGEASVQTQHSIEAQLSRSLDKVFSNLSIPLYPWLPEHEVHGLWVKIICHRLPGV
jgi:hypothetical protein